jgi:diguanylate cyclase (GGDEF)-like protein
VRAFEASVQRSADLVARYGGDEFAVILPETDRDGALRIAESMRAEVAALAIPQPRNPIHSLVTISAGVATLQPFSEASAARVIETADRALYEAKRLGRNRVAYLDIDGASSDLTSDLTEPPAAGNVQTYCHPADGSRSKP